MHGFENKAVPIRYSRALMLGLSEHLLRMSGSDLHFIHSILFLVENYYYFYFYPHAIYNMYLFICINGAKWSADVANTKMI